MNKKIITWIFILVTIAIIVLIFTLKNGDADEQTAKCIGEKATLYVSTTCPHCASQKDMFGENLKYITLVNCNINPEKCQDIMYVPSWEINGKITTGVKSIEKLKEEIGC